MKTFSIDFISILFFSLLATIYGFYLNKISANLLETWDLTNLNINIFEKSAEELELFSNDLQFFLIFFLIGLTVIIISGLVIYTYSRYRIWKELSPTKKHKHYFLKWIVMVLSLGLIIISFLLLLSSLIVMIREFLLLFYYSEIYYYVAQLISSFIGLYLMVMFINVMFAIKFSFNQSYKVWDSIGKGFGLIRNNLKKSLKICLFEWLTLILLTVIIFLPLNYFFTLSELVSYLIKLIIFVLILAWYRIVFVKHIVKKEIHHKKE
ncbi:hypothetical protein HN652_01430 [archaeon]|nr:hypothetical protein [archaeon]MBT6868845.1 hypothetical protein [archaeon]MBT7380900.1 hypothetical protein [archaeon]MBT7507655.1 hypothetical protein [archaeon]